MIYQREKNVKDIILGNDNMILLFYLSQKYNELFSMIDRYKTIIPSGGGYNNMQNRNQSDAYRSQFPLEADADTGLD